MQTTLPERSLVIKERLDTIVQEILAAGKSKIAMIVLFGSYARGDWVQDVYTENHITYVYQSDIDLLLVLKKGKYAGYKATKLTLCKVLNSVKRVNVTAVAYNDLKALTLFDKPSYLFCVQFFLEKPTLKMHN